MTTKTLLCLTGATMALAMALSFGSCTDAPGFDKQKISDTDASYYYTTEEICDIALKARASFYGADSRSSISVANVTPLKNSLKSRADESKNLLYVVNFEDEKGFALVSSAKEHNNLYAVTDYGNYNPETNDNKGLQDYMNRAEAYANSIDTGLTAIKPPRLKYLEYVYDTLAYSIIKPQVKVQWGQEFPYNMHIHPNNGTLQNAKAGCGPIALVQAMTYFEQPSQLNQRAVGYEGKTLELDWTGIKLHTRCALQNDEPTICPSNEYHSTISLLILEVGLRANAVFGLENTETIFGNLRNAAIKLGYTASNIQFYNSSLNALTPGSILILAAHNDTTHEGHGFIIDGKEYYTINVTKNIYDMGPGGLAIEGKLISSTTETISVSYAHINWGFNGLANGYYYDKVFNTANIYQYDSDCPHIINDEHFSYSTDIAFFKLSH